MNIKKIVTAGAAAFAAMATFGVEPTVSNVKAQQRYPWNALVDIDYTISGDTSGLGVSISVRDVQNNRDYQPTKSTAIQLAIGLQLDLNRTQKLLEKAGYALTRSSKADLVVQYYIERGVYSVTFINEALYDCALPLLKTGQKA